MMASTCPLISSWGDTFSVLLTMWTLQRTPQIERHSTLSQASCSATTCSTFRTKVEQQHITEASLPDAAWLLGRSLLEASPGTTRSVEQRCWPWSGSGNQRQSGGAWQKDPQSSSRWQEVTLMTWRITHCNVPATYDPYLYRKHWTGLLLGRGRFPAVPWSSKIIQSWQAGWRWKHQVNCMCRWWWWNRGLEPSSSKHQDICQVLFRSQQAELRSDDSSLFGRHRSTQHKKQSDGYPGESPWQSWQWWGSREWSWWRTDNENQPGNGLCISNGCGRWNNRSSVNVNCSQLKLHFTSHILEKYGSMHEVRVIFDWYDVQHSLNLFTRGKRLGSQTAVAHHITDSTNIAKILMKRLLSHRDTNKELTGYLADNMLQQAHYLV